MRLRFHGMQVKSHPSYLLLYIVLTLVNGSCLPLITPRFYRSNLCVEARLSDLDISRWAGHDGVGVIPRTNIIATTVFSIRAGKSVTNHHI